MLRISDNVLVAIIVVALASCTASNRWADTRKEIAKAEMRAKETADFIKGATK